MIWWCCKTVNNLSDPNQPRDGQGLWNADGTQRQSEAAMERVLATKADVMEAMDRPELGKIDFRYGNSRKGLRHIMERRDAQRVRFGSGPTGEEMARKVPRIIAHGSLSRAGENAVLEHEGHLVVLTQRWENRPSNRWILSAYDVAPGKGRRR
jgi:hypothetical protein